MAVATTTILAATAVASAAAGAYAAYSSNAAQEEMADYNKEVAENQATQERWNAEAAQQQAENEAIAAERDARKQEEMEREKFKRIKASNRAKQGMGGVGYEGTPLLLAVETAEAMEMDALEIRRQGQINAQNIRYQGQQNYEGHMTNSRSSTAQAGNYSMQAKNASTAKYSDAILTGTKGLAKLKKA